MGTSSSLRYDMLSFCYKFVKILLYFYILFRYAKERNVAEFLLKIIKSALFSDTL